MKISRWLDTENEKKLILDLTKNVFGNVEITNPSYFDWQYRNNPDGKSLVLLAQDDSKNDLLVGTNTIIPAKLIIDQEEITSSLACNVQVHPDYRKKGIFSKLLSSMPEWALANGVSSLFAVPNDNSFNSFIKEGSIEIIQLPLLVRPIKFSQYFHIPFKELLKPFDILWKKNTASHSIEEFSGDFDDSFETLARKTSKRVSIMRNRNKEFLQWRYRNHPTRKYQIFVLKKNDELLGYVITKIHPIDEKKIGVIVDFMVDSSVDKKLLKGLIDKAINYFWDNDVSLAIATSRMGLIENELLHKSGFFLPPSFLKPESLHFIIQLFNDNKRCEKMKKFENWFFTFGDYDVF